MSKRSVVVIGNFDGVHGGHRELLIRARQYAAELGTEGEPLPVVVVTFWPHPLTVIAPKKAPKLLSSLKDRIALLKTAGADQVRVVQFTAEVAAWTPQHFIETIIRPLNPALVCVGRNFAFGHRASGTVQTLLEAGDFDVETLEMWGLSGVDSSSTLIRDAIARGDISLANNHLTRPFRVRGVVIVGDQRGRLLGFPTANLPVEEGLAVPADGVYAGWVTRTDVSEASRWPAAISVGTNPTFNGDERRVESHILDRDDLELYGVEIAVDFVERLRGQIVFASADELIVQMKADVEATRKLLTDQ